MSKQTRSWEIFCDGGSFPNDPASFTDWLSSYNPNEWQITTNKKRIKNLTYRLWWSNRQGGVWVRVK